MLFFRARFIHSRWEKTGFFNIDTQKKNLSVKLEKFHFIILILHQHLTNTSNRAQNTLARTAVCEEAADSDPSYEQYCARGNTDLATSSHLLSLSWVPNAFSSSSQHPNVSQQLATRANRAKTLQIFFLPLPLFTSVLWLCWAFVLLLYKFWYAFECISSSFW